MKKVLFTFKNTRDVLLAQRAARNVPLECRILPIPRSISSECTMAIECAQDLADRFTALLQEKGISGEVHLSDEYQ